MIKKINVKTFSLLCIIISHFSLQSIQNSTVRYTTFLVASACIGTSYKIIQEFPQKVHPMILIGTSSMLTAWIYYILYQSTPEGRLKQANILLKKVSRHMLARTTFDNDQAFFDTIQDIYLTEDLPLISAYNHLIGLVPILHCAFSLINKTSAEVGRNALLKEQCSTSLARAHKLFKNISDAIKCIRSHPSYLPQLAVYKENLIQEKLTIAQEQMALAQLQNAHAQQSNTLLKWLRAIFG